MRAGTLVTCLTGMRGTAVPGYVQFAYISVPSPKFNEPILFHRTFYTVRYTGCEGEPHEELSSMNDYVVVGVMRKSSL